MVFHATLRQRSLFGPIELVRVSSGDRRREVETGWCEGHSAAARLDNYRCPVLTVHPRQLLQVVNLDIGIDDRRNAGADGGDERLRLLRAGDQSGDTFGPFERCQELGHPYALQVRMPVLSSR